MTSMKKRAEALVDEIDAVQSHLTETLRTRRMLPDERLQVITDARAAAVAIAKKYLKAEAE